MNGKKYKQSKAARRPCFIASQCTRIGQSNCPLYVTYIIIKDYSTLEVRYQDLKARV